MARWAIISRNSRNTGPLVSLLAVSYSSRQAGNGRTEGQLLIQLCQNVALVGLLLVFLPSPMGRPTADRLNLRPAAPRRRPCLRQSTPLPSPCPEPPPRGAGSERREAATAPWGPRSEGAGHWRPAPRFGAPRPRSEFQHGPGHRRSKCSEHQTQAVGADRRNQPSKPGCVASVGDLATTFHAKSSPGDPWLQH